MKIDRYYNHNALDYFENAASNLSRSIIRDLSSIAYSEELNSNEAFRRIIHLHVEELHLLSKLITYRCDRDCYDEYLSKFPNTVDLSEKRLSASESAKMDLFAIDYPELAINPKCKFGDSRHNAEKQSNALTTLIEAIFGSSIFYDIQTSVLYLVNGDEVETFTHVNIEILARALTLFVPDVMTYRSVVVSIKRRMMTLMKGMSIYNVIQFKDCYLLEGVVHKGFFTKSFPRFYINRSVYDAIETNSPTLHCKPIDELLLHLCDNDESSMKRLIGTLSIVFLNDANLKLNRNSSAQIYGPSGENGKSLFMTIIKRAFGSHNVTSFETSRLNEDGLLHSVANSLIAIDSDASGDTLKSSVANIFKKLTSADTISIKRLYEDRHDITPLASIITFTNILAKSSDKTDAFLRRLDIFHCHHKLMTTLKKNYSSKEIENWFKIITSDDAAQYLLEILLIESQRYMHSSVEIPRSSKMLKALDAYATDNNSVIPFLDEIGGPDNIVGYTAKEIKEKYESWCESNDYSPLKRKFKDTLENQFGITTSPMRPNMLQDDSTMRCSTLVSIKAYRYSDQSKHKAYLDKIKENRDAYFNAES